MASLFLGPQKTNKQICRHNHKQSERFIPTCNHGFYLNLKLFDTFSLASPEHKHEQHLIPRHDIIKSCFVCFPVPLLSLTLDVLGHAEFPSQCGCTNVNFSFGCATQNDACSADITFKFVIFQMPSKTRNGSLQTRVVSSSL